MRSAYPITYHNVSSPEVLPNSLYQYGLFSPALRLPAGAVGAAALCVNALPVPAAARPPGHCWDTAPLAKWVFAKARENPNSSLSAHANVCAIRINTLITDNKCNKTLLKYVIKPREEGEDKQGGVFSSSSLLSFPFPRFYFLSRDIFILASLFRFL